MLAGTALENAGRYALAAVCAVLVCAPSVEADAAGGNLRAVATGRLGTTVKLPAAKAVPGAEIERLRTRNSQTFEAEGGSYETHISRESMNYRDARGTWQLIDNTLRMRDGVFRNGANRYRLEVPGALGGDAVRVSSGDAWLEFGPRDVAVKTASARGPQATFAAAWAGVDLRYEADADSVKEALVVRDRASIRDFTFDLRVPFGYALEQRRSGTVLVRDAGGRVRMQLSRSTMIDALGAMHNTPSELTRTRAGWQLTVIPDREWLDDPRRSWPVTIDPTVSFGAGVDCIQESCDIGCDVGFEGYGTEYSYGSCDGTEVYSLNVGESGSPDPAGNNFVRRALVRFDLNDLLPPGAVIEHAAIDPGSDYYPTFAELDDLVIYEMDVSWNEDVTGGTRDGTTPWPADSIYDQNDPMLPYHPDDPFSTGEIEPAEHTDLVRRWWSGEHPNFGILFTKPGVNGFAETSTLNPVLVVQYARTDDPNGPVQSEAVADYVESDGVSASEALRRLRIQDRLGNIAEALIEVIEDDDFGGIWFDDAAGGRIKIGINSDLPSPPSSKTAAAADLLSDHALLDDADFVSVEWTRGQLEEALTDLGTALDDLLSANKLEVGIDEELNAVQLVRANSLTSAETAAVDDAVENESVTVTVQTVDEPDLGGEPIQAPPSVCDITDHPAPGWANIPGANRPMLSCNDPYRAGVGLIGPALRHDDQTSRAVICTGGFFARSKSDHLPYILTAGHCFDNNDGPEVGRTDPHPAPWTVWMSFDKNENQILIGDPHTYDDKPVDAGILTVQDQTPFAEGFTPGWIYVTENRFSTPPTRHDEEYEIHQVPVITKALKGTRVCFTSAVPLDGGRFTSCGKVSRVDDNTAGRKDTLRVDKCGVRPGASGGPVYKGNKAYGLMYWSRARPRLGGLLPCQMWAIKARTAADDRHVYIVTTGP